jgi:hypothetical protein
VRFGPLVEEVVLDEVEGDYLFKVLRGRAAWRGVTVRFESVVYQSVGGPNVSVSVPEEEVERLLGMGFTREDVAGLEQRLQVKILNGEIRIGEG